MVVTRSGGASFPAVIGTLTVSAPLARIRTDDRGLTLDLRPRLIKRSLRRLLDPPPAPGEPCWSASWDEIRSVDVAPRSLALYLKQRRGSRFVVLRRSVLAPLVREIEAHDVPTHQVSGTIRWFFGGDAWTERRKTV
jgi:hypothetical protein